MKTKLLPVLLAGTILLPGLATARDLTIVSWGGVFQEAQRKVFIGPFQETSGTPVAEDSWDGGIGVMRTKAQAGDANTWDLVQVEGDEEQIGCEEGIYELIDIDRLGGADAFVPGSVTDCGVPANVYAMAMAYDGAKAGAEAPQTWADFWDVEKFPGKRAMRQGPKMNLEFALMADGVAREDVYAVLATPEGVDRAFRKLDELKPNIIWWTSGNQPMQLLTSGEVALTTTYHTRVRGVNLAEGRDIRLSYDGAMFLIDSWVIMKGSPNIEAAYDFLAYQAQSEVQAQWPEQLGSGVGTAAAQALIDPALAPTLPTDPANMAKELPLDVGFWISNIDDLNARFATWSGQ